MEVLIEATENALEQLNIESNCNGQCGSDLSHCSCYDPNENEWD